VSATLRLTREGFGMQLGHGPFDISVDGSDVGAIQWKATVETAAR